MIFGHSLRLGRIIVLWVAFISWAWPAEGGSRFPEAISSSSAILSLSEILSEGKGILDTDGDGLADQVNWTIIIPDHPNAWEAASAAEIAARLSFETLAASFNLVKREGEIVDINQINNFILVGDNLRLLRRFPAASSLLRSLAPDQGLVSLVSLAGKNGILLRAGSPEALLRCTAAFFHRFPYLWDIWGREDGETFQALEKSLTSFLKESSPDSLPPVIEQVFYELPRPSFPYDSIQRLRYDQGEIREMVIKFSCPDRASLDHLYQALDSLRLDHLHGRRTELLSFAGCSRLTFRLEQGRERKMVSLERVGMPRRLLTPSFRERRTTRGPERDFDLLELFTLKGLYGDSNNDTIPDTLEGLAIIPADQPIPSLSLLGIRISLETAGMSFPLFFPANQIEEKQALIAPLLIGQSLLTQELEKAGKLKIPPLGPGLGCVLIVPRAFPRSTAAVILGGDEAGLEKTIAHLSQTFPFIEKYGEGNAQWADVRRDLEKFLKGEGGAAEAFIDGQVEKLLAELRSRQLEEIKIELILPRLNDAFTRELASRLQKLFPGAKTETKTEGMRESQVILEKEKEFTWEGDDALKSLEEKLRPLSPSLPSLEVELAVSESPQVRQELRKIIEAKLRDKGFSRGEIKVRSAYKQGFFWLREDIASRLKNRGCSRLLIRVAREEDDRRELKRFYADPNRWLQELYPIDEILARDLGLPLEKIEFELKDPGEPIYEVVAYDAADRIVLKESFSPPRKIIPYLKILPEWGTVKITPSWLRLRSGGQILAEEYLQSDLEKFWSFYQEEVLPGLHQHIMKKTGGRPTSAKQPYFKQLSIELRASEPDFRLGLDEEMISSLEAIHDELYFDTLDYLRGITEIELPERETPEDTARLSAPGNVFPVIHPSTEGKPARVKVKLEDWKASSPSALISWKEKGHVETQNRRLVFPFFKTRSLRLMGLTWNGRENVLEEGLFELELDSETEYLDLLAILDRLPSLEEKGLVPAAFNYSGLKRLTLRVKSKELFREASLKVGKKESRPAWEKIRVEAPGDSLVPDEIISPEACLAIVRELTRSGPLRGYIAGRSYEEREVPVIECFLPASPYVSLPRLITFKPTLLASGRQHANEVSATNYILKLAEKLYRDEEFRANLNKMNIVLLPMENPDGAALAYELQKLTPYHSLHAGRYSSLGVDIGSLVGVTNPLLPEALVRKGLFDRWKPDIYLNLHGYPSHEWVQQFSNYAPYLFRDYWIPKGWFAFYRSLRLPVYEPWRKAGEDLKKFIIQEMNASPAIQEFNQKFYDRYFRWAGRWQPHLAELELYEGVNIYSRRRSSQETRLTPRTQLTFVEETPELMDETAHGSWLRFLSEQGLVYLQAHIKYLKTVGHDISRIDEEVQERVRMQWLRRRPGKID